MDINLILGVGVAGVVGFYLLKALSRPITDLGRMLMRSAVAFCLIWAVNVAGGFVGFHLGLNLISAMTVGIFGLPGAALLLAVKYLV
ncbi:MAG: pro-sigmaK processing inhibitor BofA family protein [Bacillota bacterium]